ncbi:hypothetical protein, partial [Brucella sp. F8/99]|uniref:hypothetical protein n=1 Tax=Brucella sp. F8/99 TaxID=437687 RepID=UPI001AEBD5B7
KASSAHGCSPLTTLNQNFVQKGILECRQALKRVEFKSNHHPAPRFCLRMIPKNRFALLSERLQLH